MFTPYLPLAGVLCFLGFGIVWRAWLQYRRTGHVGIVLFRSARWDQRFRDGLFVVFILALIGQAVVAAVSPESLGGLSVLATPVGPVGLAAGALLMFGGVAVTVLAQLDMGKSWRIGIDDAARPGLVTGGFYRFCRNPIYFGMFAVLAGLAILLPTWLSLVVLVGAVVCVRLQVREEEAYLLKTYGGEFLAYAGRVGRFVPCIGRIG